MRLPRGSRSSTVEEAVAHGEGTFRLGGDGGEVFFEVGHPPGKPGDGLGQLAEAPPGEVLLIGVVLLQDGEPLQLGLGLGERQDRRIPRGDGLHLGKRELLAADVFGPADGRLARHDLGDESGLRLQGLIG